MPLLLSSVDSFPMIQYQSISSCFLYDTYSREKRNAFDLSSYHDKNFFTICHDVDSKISIDSTNNHREWDKIKIIQSHSLRENEKYLSWKSIQQYETDEKIHDVSSLDESRFVKNILICGDGDLSFSASVATELSELGLKKIKVVATVLEEKTIHNEGMDWIHFAIEFFFFFIFVTNNNSYCLFFDFFA